MAFIALGPLGLEWAAVHVDFDRGVILASKPGVTRISAIQNWLHLDVSDTPAAILASIAEAEGAPADVTIEEARDHLGAALMQVVPSDDQIIIGHVRSAHSLLTAALRARRQP